MEIIKTILFLLVAGFLAGSGVLVVVGGADGEYEHDGIIRIDHPYPSTFLILTDPEKRKFWVPGIKTSAGSPGEIDVGSKLRETVVVEGVQQEREFEVKTYSNGKKVTLASNDGRCDYEVTYTFSAHQTGRKTKLVFKLRAQYDHWFDKLIEPIRGADLKERVRGELEALKTVLETTNEFR